jgi:hypothetical protein
MIGLEKDIQDDQSHETDQDDHRCHSTGLPHWIWHCLYDQLVGRWNIHSLNDYLYNSRSDLNKLLHWKMYYPKGSLKASPYVLSYKSTTQFSNSNQTLDSCNPHLSDIHNKKLGNNIGTDTVVDIAAGSTRNIHCCNTYNSSMVSRNNHHCSNTAAGSFAAADTYNYSNTLAADTGIDSDTDSGSGSGIDSGSDNFAYHRIHPMQMP